MAHVADDTALILIPGMRPPVPPRPDHLGKRCPAAGLARNAGATLDLAVAATLMVAGLALAVIITAPAGVLAGAFLIGQAYLTLCPTSAEEVPSV